MNVIGCTPFPSWLLGMIFLSACSRVARTEQRADATVTQSTVVTQTAPTYQTESTSQTAEASTTSAESPHAYRTSTEPRALWVGHHIGHWGPQDRCKLTDEGALTCDGKIAIGNWGKPRKYLAKNVRVPPKVATQLLDEVEASASSTSCVLHLKERDARNEKEMALLRDGGERSPLEGYPNRDKTGSWGSICKGGYGPNTVCSGAGCGKASVCFEACDNATYEKVLTLRKQYGQQSASPN
jgi:hypothetical protein